VTTKKYSQLILDITQVVLKGAILGGFVAMDYRNNLRIFSLNKNENNGNK
jgi:hypothetical protein